MNDLSGSDAFAKGRERCPTCNAPRQAESVCYRCKSDLSSLIALEIRVDNLRAHARRCYARGWYRRAAELTRELLSLEACSEDLALLACASLMSGDFPSAVHAYRRNVYLSQGNSSCSMSDT